MYLLTVCTVNLGKRGLKGENGEVPLGTISYQQICSYGSSIVCNKYKYKYIQAIHTLYKIVEYVKSRHLIYIGVEPSPSYVCTMISILIHPNFTSTYIHNILCDKIPHRGD